MNKIRLGQTYKVTEYSGLDSGRVGIAIPYNHTAYNQVVGIYKPFDHKNEVLLYDCNGQDYNGKYFTMFKNRLIQVCNG